MRPRLLGGLVREFLGIRRGNWGRLLPQTRDADVSSHGGSKNMFAGSQVSRGLKKGVDSEV